MTGSKPMLENQESISCTMLCLDLCKIAGHMWLMHFLGLQYSCIFSIQLWSAARSYMDFSSRRTMPAFPPYPRDWSWPLCSPSSNEACEFCVSSVKLLSGLFSCRWGFLSNGCYLLDKYTWSPDILELSNKSKVGLDRTCCWMLSNQKFVPIFTP